MAKAESRNYQKEYANERPERRKERAMRNKARRELMAEGKLSKGDGKVADHKKPLSKGGSTSRSNVRVQSASASHSQGGKLQKVADKRRGGRN